MTSFKVFVRVKPRDIAASVCPWLTALIPERTISAMKDAV
ncbi:Uncharacterised protein [Vibrio cholerae]|nr:Uncharacterised protein [Vibrio cholerae]